MMMNKELEGSFVSPCASTNAHNGKQNAVGIQNVHKHLGQKETNISPLLWLSDPPPPKD